MFVETKKWGRIKICDDTQMFLENFLGSSKQEEIEDIINNVIKCGIFFISLQSKLSGDMLQNIDKEMMGKS